jgi:hypothetical protein
MQVTELLNELDNYILDNKNIYKFINFNIKNDKPKTNKKPVSKTTTNNMFFPPQYDQLFWCFYIILFNKHEYDIIHNFFTKEKEIKYNWIEEFRKHKHIFKTIKVSRNNVEDELANKKQITMNSIKALCYLFNINLFFIDNKKYYEILIDENMDSYVIEKIDNKFGLKQNINKDNIKYYKENYWQLNNLDKPLKAISSYKSDDLKSICKKLNIECNKLTKPQMYEKIINIL